jgi:dienelactone hydrolase
MLRSFIYNCSVVTMLAAGALVPSPASAVTFTTEVVNTTDSYKTVLFKPQSNPNAHVGVFVMHASSRYSSFAGCSALATRGFTMLCADSVFTNRQYEYKGYEDHAAAITAGIQFLRNQPGITKVVIFGHSMGAPMMSFYAWVQENGIRACQDRARLLACNPTNLVDDSGASKLLPVDGVILFDAHLGDALATYTYMDPAIKDPDEPGVRDEDLDMFAKRNGYPGDEGAGSPDLQERELQHVFQGALL